MLSPLVILLSSSAFALDCSGLHLDLCDAANVAAAQINSQVGRTLVHDGHSNPRMRPAFIYDRFVEMFDEAQGDCPSGQAVLEGTVAAKWNIWRSGNGAGFRGFWDDASLTEGGTVRGRLDLGSQTYTGLYDEDPNSPMGEIDAWYSGTRTRGFREDGFWGGAWVQFNSRNGYFATIYGSCEPPAPPPEPEPVVMADHYDVVGNTPLMVGGISLLDSSSPQVTATMDLLANDPDGAVSSVVGVTGCSDTTAPFECETAQGGMLYVNTDGSFAYSPPPRMPNGNIDYFEAEIRRNDGTVTVSSPVELEQVTRVWYASDAYPGSGDGDWANPFSSLDFAENLIQDGDVLHVTGGVASYTEGAVVSGNVRIISSAVPLTVDVPLNGQSAPVTLAAGNGIEAWMGADRAPAITIDTDAGAATVRIEGFELSGNVDTPAVIAVRGAESYDLEMQHNTFRWVDTRGVWIDGAGSAATQPNRLEMRDNMFEYAMNPIVIDNAGTATTEAHLSNMMMFEIDHAVTVNATGDSALQLYIENLEALVQGSLLSFSGSDYANAELLMGMNRIDTEGQVVSIDNHTVQGDIRMTFAANDVYAYQSPGPLFELVGSSEGFTTAGLFDTMLTSDGTAQAVFVETTDRSATAIEVDGMWISGALNGPAIEVRSGSSYTDQSAVCLEVDHVEGYGGNSMLVSQHDGSDFYVAAPFWFDGQSPHEVQMALEDRNQLHAVVDTATPAVVSYTPVGSCGVY